MSDNIISINNKKKTTGVSTRERVESCMYADMFDMQHEGCAYCRYRHETAKMLFDILMNDMESTIKKSSLDLTNVDVELTIAHILNLFVEYDNMVGEILEQKKSESQQETGRERKGHLQQVESGEPQSEKTDSPTGEVVEPKE